ncbi:hypothetical protein E2980_23835 [Cohnella luojiensis]|uniref:Uncharacterized protein n=1 Tax=Cohnella luojiensis TaxID=652876 RepID=A0A4Y8LTE9_9BACL|nr:hypothetical protein E2980_23835 [Cohnella luojiensis]
MRRIDGGKDNALTWGDLYGTRSNLRNLTCESRQNVQKSAEAIVRRCCNTSGRAEHEIGFVHRGVQGKQ